MDLLLKQPVDAIFFGVILVDTEEVLGLALQAKSLALVLASTTKSLALSLKLKSLALAWLWP